MKTYSIGEAALLLGIKPHVIRYWEKEFPFLKPDKDSGGRRQYSEREVHLLFRLKFLLYTRRFTLEGAKQKIWEELATGFAGRKSSIHEIRGDVLKILSKIADTKKV